MNTADKYKKGDVVKDWQEQGVRCIIMRGPVSFCAYIGVPDDHPLAGFGYEDISLECHGGLTYSGKKVAPAGWHFYGWDYGHSGDQCVYEMKMPNAFEGKAWTVEEVESEVKSVLYDFIKIVRLAEKIKNK